MVISTCGFGSTGSSAVSDYLLECENVQVFDNIEFTLATTPDGLEDLEYHLLNHNSRLFSGESAIYRFKKLVEYCARGWVKSTSISRKQIEEYTDRFINAIAQLKYVGDPPANELSLFQHYLGYSLLLHRIVYKAERKKILTENRNYYPLREVYSSVKPDNFYVEAQKYVKSLLSAMGCDTTMHLVLDQAFSGNDPAKSFPFFEDPYAIVVDRDPRDLYIFGKKVLLSRGRFMPTDTVENFITYYRMLREKQPYKESNPRVMKINFEELVYDYDNATSRIDCFLNVRNIKRKTIFKPELSVANTNLIKKYPEFEMDIKKIEENLGEYLFDFRKYPEVAGSSDVMFYGKSPLNKR